MLVVFMEIIEFLLYFFLEEYGGEDFLPLLDSIKENNFDIVKTIKNLPPEKLAPIIKGLFKNKERKENSSRSVDLSVIKNIANLNIYSMLENYLSALG